MKGVGLMLKSFIVIFFICIINAQAISIDNKTEFHNILSQSEVYIDKSQTLTFTDILHKDVEFIKNEQEFLAYGYAPDFNVWVKFTLTNTTNKDVHNTIEYDNPLTTHIELFDELSKTSQKEGLYQVSPDRKTTNPIFKITLNPQESKTYYIKASSHITTLIVKLKIWDTRAFYEKEVQHQFILGLFFASMLILAIYNLFIYFFTKDISYLYYVLYLFGIIAHQMIYTGMSNSYIFTQNLRIAFIEYAPIVVALPIFFLALFTKSFLKLNQYKVYNSILSVYLVIFPFIIVILIVSNPFNQFRNIFTLILQVYLVLMTVYAAYKHNRQAYFILFGWFVVMFAGTFMYLSSIGLFDIHQSHRYIVEIAFVLEAVIFSIALADCKKRLQEEKESANNQLLFQQRNEQRKLEIKVEEKTRDLKNIADEKEMLLKELNHRVKNNMQTIISLIRLQLDDIDDLYVRNILSTTYNRITAMSHLHELLYYQTDVSNINANDYFVLLTDEIQESYAKNIKIHLAISTDLHIDQAIYCGLILNELATNAFKHAFTNNTGNLYIELSKADNLYLLSVVDDGIGYHKKISSNSLGLVLVNSLVKSKLHGKINLQSEDGVSVKITWKDNDE
ncbi:MAG: two-component sensor histidine kinase [Sulfurimonas sp.]